MRSLVDQRSLVLIRSGTQHVVQGGSPSRPVSSPLVPTPCVRVFLPRWTRTLGNRTVDENADLYDFIGDTVSASDEDVTQDVFFSIVHTYPEGNDGLFAITSCGGEVRDLLVLQPSDSSY